MSRSPAEPSHSLTAASSWPFFPPGAPGLVLGAAAPVSADSGAAPDCVVLPSAGLRRGLAVFGGSGSGKTTGCLAPLLRQFLEVDASDAQRSMAGFVLADGPVLPHVARSTLAAVGRSADHVLIGTVPGSHPWNPLDCPWVDTYALAHTLGSIASTFFFSSPNRFWQQAYTDVFRSLILAFRLLSRPFTFRDLHAVLSHPEALAGLINRVAAHHYDQYSYLVQLSVDDFARYRDRLLELVVPRPGADSAGGSGLAPEVFRFHPPESQSEDPLLCWVDCDDRVGTIVGDRALLGCKRVIESAGLRYSVSELAAPTAADQQAVDRLHDWYASSWCGLDESLRESIVKGLVVFLEPFTDPSVGAAFCPSSTDPRLLPIAPSFPDCIESGKVVVLRVPSVPSLPLVRAIGILAKASFLAAVQVRDPGNLPDGAPDASVSARRRPVFFISDGYEFFASGGQDHPLGDAKLIALGSTRGLASVVAVDHFSMLPSRVGGDPEAAALLAGFQSRLFLRGCPSEALSLLAASSPASSRRGRSSSTGSAVTPQASVDALTHMEALAQVHDGKTVLPPVRIRLDPTWGAVRPSPVRRSGRPVL